MPSRAAAASDPPAGEGQGPPPAADHTAPDDLAALQSVLARVEQLMRLVQPAVSVFKEKGPASTYRLQNQLSLIQLAKHRANQLKDSATQTDPEQPVEKKPVEVAEKGVATEGPPEKDERPPEKELAEASVQTGGRVCPYIDNSKTPSILCVST